MNARRQSCVTFSSQFSNFQLLLLFLYQLHIYRLTFLSLTPRGSATALLCYWLELLDLVYFYKARHNIIHLDPSVVPLVRECARRTRISVTRSQSFVPKKMKDFYLSEIFFH